MYTSKLSQQGCLLPFAVEVLENLSKKYDCYIITNGITEVQRSRISLTPLGNYIKHSFVSQELGWAKPSPIFFEKVLEYIGDADKKKYLVIGDSLTSDIKGACDSGLDSVWISSESNPLPTYRIERLQDLYSILD